MIGVLVPVSQLSFNHIINAIYVGVTLALCQGVGQVINQYADVEIDKMAKPYRPLPAGILTREEALGFGWLLSIFVMGRAFTVSTIFGIAVLVLLFLSVFYSLAPFSPRKVHPILNLAWLSISRGLMPMIAVLTIYGNLGQALPYALLATIWVFGFQATKDIPDVEADKKYGIKTVPNTYGTWGLKTLMLASTAAYVAITITLGKPLMLLTIPLAITAILGLERKTVTENTLGWTCFYLGLALQYLLILVGRFTIQPF